MEPLDFDAFITACGLCYESYTYITGVLQYFLFIFLPLSVPTFLLNPNSEQIRAGGSNFPFFGAETQQVVGKKV